VTTRHSTKKHVHPFPARMAPELALDKIELLTEPGDTVLDPMCGSGTVVRLAAEEGRFAIGADLDPLAVMITRTAAHGAWVDQLEERAAAVVSRARRFGTGLPEWIARDDETADFVLYWFAQDQIEDLSRLARALDELPVSGDPLRVALSRIIVTKEGGASLARDTAHSRPHRVRDDNDFDVLGQYVQAAKKVASFVNDAKHQHRPSVRRADARTLAFVPSRSVDLVVTSPPYLNAIDYIRGHRLSLIWLGWTVGELRDLRGISVGAERGLDTAPPELRAIALKGNRRMGELSDRHQRMVLRFTQDMRRLSSAMARVTKRGGHLVLVVADSQLGGIPISNSGICKSTAEEAGFRLIETTIRPLPTHHRYLPPPTTTSSTLALRMKEEIVYTFTKV
jgi:DNA modification methylase